MAVCLLIVDQVGCFDDKLFGIVLKLFKDCFLNPGKNFYNRLSGQPSLGDELSYQIIFHAVACVDAPCGIISSRFFFYERSAFQQCLLGLYLVHGAEFYLEEYLGNSKVAIEGRNRFFHKFFGIEANNIDRFGG